MNNFPKLLVASALLTLSSSALFPATIPILAPKSIFFSQYLENVVVAPSITLPHDSSYFNVDFIVSHDILNANNIDTNSLPDTGSRSPVNLGNSTTYSVRYNKIGFYLGIYSNISGVSLDKKSTDSRTAFSGGLIYNLNKDWLTFMIGSYLYREINKQKVAVANFPGISSVTTSTNDNLEVGASLYWQLDKIDSVLGLGVSEAKDNIDNLSYFYNNIVGVAYSRTEKVYALYIRELAYKSFSVDSTLRYNYEKSDYNYSLRASYYPAHHLKPVYTELGRIIGKANVAISVSYTDYIQRSGALDKFGLRLAFNAFHPYANGEIGIFYNDTQFSSLFGVENGFYIRVKMSGESGESKHNGF